MGLSATTTIFLFVVCLCGGIVIGAMFGRMKKAPPEEKKPQEEEPEAAEKPEEPDALPQGLAREGGTEILRAWRDEADRIWLEMDNQRLDSRDDLDSQQKKKLLRMLLDLRPWLDTPTAAATTPPVQAAPPPPSPVPGKTKVGGKVLAAVEEPAVSLKSIVEQINDVLQEKLEGTTFESLKIKLLEGPGGDALVQIGSVRHAGVDAIPNPEIQAIIRAAVAEWERRSR